MTSLCWKDCSFPYSARYQMLWFCSQGNKLLLSSFSENICKTESRILIIENASCSNAICIRMFLDPWRKFTVFWTKYQQRNCGSLMDLKATWQKIYFSNESQCGFQDWNSLFLVCTFSWKMWCTIKRSISPSTRCGASKQTFNME